jgi:hypothetical protein
VRLRELTQGEAAVRRDNFDWTAISVKMGTRSAAALQAKWYDDLAPSMREAGEWARGEDALLLAHLHRGGCEEETEVEWAAAVPGRSGLVSLRRWHLMLKVLPGYVDLTFSERVARLVAMKAPGLLAEGDDAVDEEDDIYEEEDE